ncbi:hypothetical protein C8Q72DRAFT_791843 [Fomitopsis betulina]|nr:hypothetical protein C8Q72DRAFT_791843 [Fomitopsis betulina]
MSPNAPMYTPSSPPSADASPLDLRYSSSDSSSESAGSPPPDSPLGRAHAALPTLHLNVNLPQRKHLGPYSSGTSDYSPSPTNIEFAPPSVPPTQPNVQTVPVIPTLLSMPSLAPETSYDADAAKAHSEEEHFPSSPTESHTGPTRVRSKESMLMGLSSPLDNAPYDPSHPYARIYTRKEGAKRRKMWNHAHEKSLFTPQEMRTIYTASLEAHIDRLHAQLLGYALFPVPFEKLDSFRGLNTKTAKSMVAGLHRDANDLRVKRLELERAYGVGPIRVSYTLGSGRS